jgi:hypothetical protein
VNAAIDNRASVIREYIARIMPPVDPTDLFRYSVLAARWEFLRLLAHNGGSTPDDDRRFRELTPLLAALTARIDLPDVATEDHSGPDAVPDITTYAGHLPLDIGELMGETWHESAALWFTK